ncbi:lipopolysaccharide biosynthesis protein [Microscilla marina]|uniref:Membrane protein, putative n=1 Tax=Microscilla marina ATCC 23134 TaxID=313606 RepID=A1ZI90_MICM2|nr:oligosaccharide flippase family protein [Microscilla marina]EAY29758.1 membrane protein, putative [Microscilla marina ATCC 23134]
MKFLKNFATYSLADILSKSILLVVSPILTRLLTPHQYGTIPLFIALWGVISVLQYCEMGTTYTMFIAQTDNKKERTQIRITGTYIAITTFFIIWILFFIVSMSTNYVTEYVQASKTELMFFLLGLIPSSIAYWATFILRYMHQALPFVRITMINKVFSIAIALPCIYLVPLKQRLTLFLIVVFVIQMLSLLWVYMEFKKLNITFLKKAFFIKPLAKKMASYGVRFLPSSILFASTVFVDRLLVGYFADNADVGVLGLALQLSAGILMVKSWFSLVWDPHLIEWIATKQSHLYLPKLKKAIILVSIIFFSITLIAKIWGQSVIGLIYPESFKQVGELLPIIVLAGTTSVFSLIAIATVTIANTPRFRVRLNTIALIVNITTGILLIPVIGIKGAVYGTLLSEISIFLSWIIIGKYILKNLPLPWVLPLLLIPITFLFIYFYTPGSLLNVALEQIILTIIIGTISLSIIYKTKYYLIFK